MAILKRQINIQVENINLPISIKGNSEEELQKIEEKYRKAGQDLNKKVIQLRSQYLKIDASVLYAMVAFNFAISAYSSIEDVKESSNELDDFMEKVRALNVELKDFINE